MTPSVVAGARVVIAAAEAPETSSGDVVLFACHPYPVLHRVLHVARVRERVVVFHRGDAGGVFGVVDGSTVLGKVVAVLSPEAGPAPALHTLPPRIQRSFRRARWLARFAALALRLGLRRSALPGSVRTATERLLP